MIPHLTPHTPKTLINAPGGWSLSFISVHVNLSKHTYPPFFSPFSKWLENKTKPAPSFIHAGLFSFAHSGKNLSKSPSQHLCKCVLGEVNI